MKWIKTGSFLLIFLMGFPAFSQEAEVIFSNENPLVGEALLLEIRVSGAEQIEVPTLTGNSNFLLQYRGEAHSISTGIINGKRTQLKTTGYQWILTPLKPGLLNFPSITLSLDGEIFQTEPESLQVSEATEVEGYQLELLVDNPLAFAGQPVRCSLVLSFKSSLRNPQFILPALQDNHWTITSVQPSPDQEDVRRVVIGEEEFFGSLSSAYRKGEQVSIFTLPFNISRADAGNYSLNEAIVSFDYPRGKDIFGDPLYARSTVTSKRESLEILNLPEPVKNTPLGVLMAKDSLDISLRTKPRVLKKGDPLELIMTFRGLAYPEQLQISDPQQVLTWGESFQPMNQKSTQRILQDGSVEISMRMRFTGEKTPEIPRTRIPYLNLNSREVQYVIPMLSGVDTEAVLSEDSAELEIWGDKEKEDLSPEKQVRELKNPPFLSLDRLGSIQRIPPLWITLMLLLSIPIMLLLLYVLIPWIRNSDKSSPFLYPWEQEGVEPIAAWDSWVEKQPPGQKKALSLYREDWEKRVYGGEGALWGVCSEMTQLAEKEKKNGKSL